MTVLDMQIYVTQHNTTLTPGVQRLILARKKKMEAISFSELLEYVEANMLERLSNPMLEPGRVDKP